MAGTDPRDRAGNANGSNSNAFVVQYWSTHTSCAEDSLLVVHGVTLTPNLLQFLTELNQIPDGFRSCWLKHDAAKHAFTSTGWGKSSKCLTQSSGVQGTTRSNV